MRVAPIIKIVPAIYELKDRRWGWIRINDLTKVVNNLLKLRGSKTHLEPQELIKSFEALTHVSNEPIGLYWASSGDFKWFEECKDLTEFTNDCFISASWGKNVVKSVKAGAIKVSLIFQHERNEFWGKKENGRKFRIKL